MTLAAPAPVGRSTSKQLSTPGRSSQLEAAGAASLVDHRDHRSSGEPWSLRELDNGHSYTSTGTSTAGMPRLQAPQGRKTSLGHPTNVAQVHDVSLGDFLARSNSKHHTDNPLMRSVSKEQGGELTRSVSKDVAANAEAATRQPAVLARDSTSGLSPASVTSWGVLDSPHSGQENKGHRERRLSGSKTEAHDHGHGNSLAPERCHNRTLTAAEAQERSASVMQWFRASHEINERCLDAEEREHIIEDARRKRAAYTSQRSNSGLPDGTQSIPAGFTPGGPPRPPRRGPSKKKPGEGEPDHPEPGDKPPEKEVAKSANIYDAVALWGAKPLVPKAEEKKEEAPKKTGCIFEGVKVGSNDLRERLASKRSSARAESKVSTAAGDTNSESQATSKS
mmetsp:Transcript_63904/g.152413  ORF Transcript_63904/g.152413 Transcript_63904/m.152413 type:complete len:393 (-) Transcript_63904:125-1303(-)